MAANNRNNRNNGNNGNNGNSFVVPRRYFPETWSYDANVESLTIRTTDGPVEIKIPFDSILGTSRIYETEDPIDSGITLYWDTYRMTLSPDLYKRNNSNNYKPVTSYGLGILNLDTQMFNDGFITLDMFNEWKAILTPHVLAHGGRVVNEPYMNRNIIIGAFTNNNNNNNHNNHSNGFGVATEENGFGVATEEDVAHFMKHQYNNNNRNNSNNSTASAKGGRRRRVRKTKKRRVSKKKMTRRRR